MAAPTEIKLGDTDVPVYPQRWAYLANRCGSAVTDALAKGDSLEAQDILTFIGDGAFTLLSALVPSLPKRMTAEEWASEDQGPTIPEIREAFRVALEVNGLHDLPDLLGKALGPSGTNLLRATMLQRAVEGSTDSATSPSTSGDSDLTSSTATSPAPTASEASPSPASAA